MDISKIVTAALVNKIAQQAGASKKDTQSVLEGALPALLGSMTKSAGSKSSAESLLGAMLSHSEDDHAKDVDEEDGAKILGHLLGGQQAATTKNVAAQAGVNAVDVEKILKIAAPIIMASLGKQAVTSKKKSASADASGLLAGILSQAVGAQVAPKAQGTAQKAQAKEDDGIDAADVLKLVGKLLK